MKKYLIRALPAIVFIIGLASVMAAGYWLYTERFAGEAIIPSLFSKDKSGLQEGRWGLQVEDTSSVDVSFTAQDGYYEVLYVPANATFSILSSRGTYEYNKEDGTLTLKPMRGLGLPRSVAERRVEFLNLRTYTFPVQYKRFPSRMVWTGGQRLGHVNREHPLFVRIDPENRELVWHLVEKE